MNVETLLLEDAEGNKNPIKLPDYQKHLIKELDIKGFLNDGNQVTAEVVVAHIIKQTNKGAEIDPTIGGGYPDLVKRVEADFKASAENVGAAKKEAGDDKEAKKAEKEAAEKAQKEKDEAAEKQRSELAPQLVAGSATAHTQFGAQLAEIKKSLPEGVQFVNEGKGWQIKVVEGTSKEVVAQAMGYIVGLANNNEALAGVLQMSIGDMINTTVAVGICSTAKEAAEYVSKQLGLDGNKAYSSSALSYYAKMADRTPLRLRNAEAPVTAYLALANMALPKPGKDEKQEDFVKRKQKFEADREALQEKLANGEIVRRADILQPIEDLLINNGIKVKKTGDEVSISDLYIQYVHASIGLEYLVDNQFDKDHPENEGKAIYKDGEKLYPLTKDELEALRDEALTKILNLKYSEKKPATTIKDYEKGYVTKVEEKIVKKGKDGATREKVETQVKVWPKPFWTIEAADEGAEAPAEPAATGEAETKTETPAETPAAESKKEETVEV